jgi:hypothetical protein
VNEMRVNDSFDWTLFSNLNLHINYLLIDLDLELLF